MLYRIKQFYWDITSSIRKIDEKFIDRYLNKEDKKLFYSLKKAEQQHSLRVAKLANKKYKEKNYININKDRLIKICLLHDVGKINGNLNVFDRTFLVLGNRILRGRMNKFNNLKKINTYYNHPAKGAKILKELGYDEEFVYVVRNHHKLEVASNEILNLLKQCDELS